jgi:N-carbamoylputrescine amidase
LLPENGTHVMSEHRRPFNVGLIQMRCSTDTTDNLTRACSLLRQAAERGAQVVCLPELFGTQYFCQVEDAARFDLAEPIPGPTTEALADVARTCGIVVVGSIFERRAAGIYHNTAVVLDADGTLRGRFARMGTLVCWDQWYPEAARLTALQGAEILFYPTAIGWHPAEKAEFGEAQTSAWATIQRSHAIANGVYVAAVNRVGHEGPAGGGLEFWGGSFVADPFGRLIAEAGRDGEEIVIARCDPRLQEETRRNWPFLRDRRIDAYAPITQRFLDRREP